MIDLKKMKRFRTTSTLGCKIMCKCSFQKRETTVPKKLICQSTSPFFNQKMGMHTFDRKVSVIFFLKNSWTYPYVNPHNDLLEFFNDDIPSTNLVCCVHCMDTITCLLHS